MGNGAIPGGPINDTVSGVIALDVSHLWERHRKLEQAHERHLGEETTFRNEIFGRVGHLENTKWLLRGIFAIGVLVFGFVWAFGGEVIQNRVEKVVAAQTKEDHATMKAKFEAYDKDLEDFKNQIRQEALAPAEAVRRRR